MIWHVTAEARGRGGSLLRTWCEIYSNARLIGNINIGCRTRTRISCRWQTGATHCITANVLQTNKVDALCDKLATELSRQRFASKVANLPQLHLTSPLGVTPFEFYGDFWQQKNRVPGLSCGVICVILRSAVSVEHRFVTDRQTHDDS